MRRVILFVVLLTAYVNVATASSIDTVYISTMSTTHIRFSSELKYVDLSNKVLSARIVEGSKDIVAVKAKEVFDFTATMSCLEADGRLHTYVVTYDESPDVLIVDLRRSPVRPWMTSIIEPGMTGLQERIVEDKFNLSDSSDVSVFEALSQMERGVYHIGDVEYDIRIMCENIAIKDDVTYLVLSLKNMSAVSYAMSSPRFVIESKRKTKRGLVYEKQIFPKHCYGEGVTAPHTASRIVYSFDKVTLAKGQVFRIYFYEDGGPRNFVLSFGIKDLRNSRCSEFEPSLC